MLVLGVNVGSRVRITLGKTEVWVEVVKCSSDRMRLGFAAPLEVVIDRESVALAKDRNELERMLDKGEP